ncbi:MAG: glycosyltransferase family 9 protein [Candidatus Adiutrix sp.]|jgi:lipopolysaccharide heptosyltransferase I|nr:glycosyltransferase family 9 protein [Candidatus Adiutrix sp.]
MKNTEIRKLLIVKMSAVGDVVMALPALAALRRAWPGAAIDWLAEPPAAGLLEGLPGLRRLIVSPRRGLGGLVKGGRPREARRLLWNFRTDLRSEDYDVVLDLQGLWKSAVNVWLSRGRRKVGFARTREHSGWALNEKMPAYDPEKHAVRRYLDAAAYLGADPSWPATEPYYQPPPAAEAEAGELLAALGESAGAFLVLNPGAKWLTKRWPLRHWERLAARASASGRALVVTGGREDLPLGQAISQAAEGGGVLNLCGRTSLPVLGAVLARASAVITADTGPMHLAAAVGGGGLALFGPTRPKRTGPFGGHFQIMTPPAGCLGCLKKNCPQPCLELLSPELVWDRAHRFLEQEARPCPVSA